MAKVTGLGGLFYKVADPERTKLWYEETLGLGGEWGIMFPFAAEPEGFSLLSTFKDTSDYFAPSDKPFMINLRVDDLRPLRVDRRLRRGEDRALPAPGGCAGLSRRAPKAGLHP